MARKPPPRGRAAAERYPGKVRIIAGTWRGRFLEVPQATGLRPTPNRVRETLFNWLTPWLPGATCIDLFAGTGALCLEALSRGAARVIMVERHGPAAAALRANIARLSAKGAEVVEGDALDFLARPAQTADIVFLDPPFAAAVELIGRCAARLEDGGWLKPAALIYVEAPIEFELSGLPSGWERFRHGAAGAVGFHLFRRQPKATPGAGN